MVLGCSLAACSWANLDGFTGGTPDGGTPPIVLPDGNVVALSDGSALSPADATTADASEGGPCDLTKPFDKPAPIPALNSASNENTARLSPDELTVYFQSTRPGGLGGADVYVATRASRDASFDAPVALTEVNTPTDDYDPTISADGKTLIVSQKGGLDQDLFAFTRAAPSGPFGQRAEVPNVNAAQQGDFQAFLTADGTLAFARGTVIKSDLFLAGGTLGAFNGANPLVALNTLGLNGFPVLTNDGLTIYFGSTRGTGAGGFDIWVAKRASTGAVFGTPTAVAELNSANNDVPTWISADGCRLYMASERGGGSGGADIYLATRPK